MTDLALRLHLISDATFGRGDGLAGVVNSEVQHDPCGLPYLSGKTLKGLLGAECAEILFALNQSQHGGGRWEQAARRLFGEPGSSIQETGQMHVGDACLPASLRQRLKFDFAALTAGEQGRRQRANLESLTALRRQTAMETETGAPLRNSLRTMRVIVRETAFTAELSFLYDIEGEAYAVDRGLLAACAKALRRAGTGRNRGRGRLRTDLLREGASVLPSWFELFQQEANQ